MRLFVQTAIKWIGISSVRYHLDTCTYSAKHAAKSLEMRNATMIGTENNLPRFEIELTYDEAVAVLDTLRGKLEEAERREEEQEAFLFFDEDVD